MVKRIFLVLFIIIMIISFPMNVNATESDLPEEYDDFIEGLPEDIKDLLPEGLFSHNSNDILKAIEAMSGWEYIFNIISDFIGLNFKDIIKVTATLFSIIIISSIIRAIKDTISNKATYKILDLISCAVLVLTVIDLTKIPLERTKTLLDNIKLFVNTVSPLICSMYAMGGNINSALVNNYGFIVFLSIFENICILALEMIMGVCISLTIASVFINDVNLISLSSTIKKTFTFFVGFVMIVFTTVISTQNLISSKADTLTTKTAKMLVGQMIPLVGNVVGDSLKTAGASIEYLRSSIGVASLILLLLMLAPGIISIFLYRLSFNLSNSIAGLLGCKREESVLAELSGIYGYALAVLSICSIALIFLLTVFAKSASPLTY